MRSLILNILLSASAIAASIFLLSDIAADIHVITESSPPSAADIINNSSDLDAALRYLISANHLATGDRAICVGPHSAAVAGSMRRLGFPSTSSADVAGCDLAKLESDSFDFAIGVDLDRVRVPAMAILEMERVLKTGRVGVVLRVGSDLMRVAAPVMALLRLSDVVGATAMNGSVMVVFKKWGPVLNSNDNVFQCYDGMTKLPSIFGGIYEVLRAASLVGGVYAGHLV